MELDYAILATAAEATNGKLNLLGGGFDTINADEVPFSMQPFALAARFTVTGDECDQDHSIGVDIVSPDGDVKEILKDEGALPFKRSGECPRQHALGIIQIGHTFETYGQYKIRLYGDGNLMKEIELNVRNPKQAKGK